jgi:hypothetical protein
MKKFFIIAGSILTIFVILFLVLFLSINSMVKSGIEDIGTEMTGGTVDLYTEVGGERSARVETSSIELHDLGRGGGQQALEDVIKEIAEDIAEEAMRGAVRSGGEQIRDAIRKLFD